MRTGKISKKPNPRFRFQRSTKSKIESINRGKSQQTPKESIFRKPIDRFPTKITKNKRYETLTLEPTPDHGKKRNRYQSEEKNMNRLKRRSIPRSRRRIGGIGGGFQSRSRCSKEAKKGRKDRDFDPFPFYSRVLRSEPESEPVNLTGLNNKHPFM